MPASPSFWRMQLAGWAGYAALMVMTFLPLADAEGGLGRLIHLKVAHAALGLAASSVLVVGYRRIARLRVVASLLGAAALGVAWALAGLAYAWAIGVELDMPDEIAYFPRRVLEDAVVLLGWSALYFAIRHARALRAAHDRALRAELGAERARLAALRHQLHPHFLFNTLSSIRALIDDDPARAHAMVTGVADLLRYSLAGTGEAPVALGDELAAVAAYLAIEAIRFEDQLEVELAVDPAARKRQVPPFVVLPLVENAIKHGFAPGARLRVRVRAERIGGDGERAAAANPEGAERVRAAAAPTGGAERTERGVRIEVANTGHWRPERAGGTGLANLRARLAAEGATLAVDEADGWVRAVITVPA